MRNKNVYFGVRVLLLRPDPALSQYMDHFPREKRTPTKYTTTLEAFRALANCHCPYGAI
jgi:hypothetical protein